MKRKISGSISISFFVILVFALNSCRLVQEMFKNTQKVFVSSRISNYNIKKIALLPMIPDTDDSNGTYAATNYFMDLLVTEFPKLEFAEVNDLRKYDFDFIPQVIENLSEYKILDLKNFMETDLGIKLKKWNCDAVLMGVTDSISRKSKLVQTGIFEKSVLRVYVVVYFRYYLVSLKDGRILWKIRQKGTDVAYPFGDSNFSNILTDNQLVAKLTTISFALCNGIEILSYKLPDEIFESKW